MSVLNFQIQQPGNYYDEFNDKIFNISHRKMLWIHVLKLIKHLSVIEPF